MAVYSYYAYAPGALIYNSGSNSWSLRPDYDPSLHRVEIRNTDNDAYVDADWNCGETGDGTDQTAQVFDMGGNLITSGVIYSETCVGIEHPDTHVSEFDIMKIAGTFVGHMVEEPLVPGVTYPQSDTGNVGTAADTGYGDTRQTYANVQSVPCFQAGTMISTDKGEVPVDWLLPGDLVLTRDNGYQPIIWLGRFDPHKMTPDLPIKTVRIPQGAFGPGRPARSLSISPNHQILLSGPALELHFGAAEMLAKAKHVAEDHLITLPPKRTRTLFFQVLLPDHEVILAEGLWVASLFAQNEVIQLQPPAIRRRIEAQTAGRHLQSARACLRQFEIRALGLSHVLASGPDQTGGAHCAA